MRVKGVNAMAIQDRKNDLLTIILAAGEGKRMRSKTPKVLHTLCGEAMIAHVLRAASIEGAKSVVVVGHGAGDVEAYLGDRVQTAIQTEQRGTGHAVMAARRSIEAMEGGYVLVVAGDMPLLRARTLEGLVEWSRNNGAAATVLSAMADDPKGYGRLIRDMDGNVTAIVEDKDATVEQKLIHEVNTSVWCFEKEALIFALDRIHNDNQQHEYYLTDCAAILTEAGQKVGALPCDPEEALGVNDRVQLATAAKVLQRRINTALMLEGVQILDPDACIVDARAIIEPDVVIYPGNVIEGESRIGAGTVLYPGNFIESATVGESNKIGPNAHLRPKTVTGKGCRVGNFVELKNVVLGDGAKVSHLAYCGDGEIGAKSNISCGVIFSNYDGVRKFRTTIGENVFVGCNANLVAPVTLGDGAYVAAGSTITNDVPSGDLAIARERQTLKSGWAARRAETYHKE